MLTAVRFSFGRGGPERSFVWVVENYDEEAVRSVVTTNPGVFWPDVDWNWEVIRTFNDNDDFVQWAETQDRLDGWTAGLRLDRFPSHE